MGNKKGDLWNAVYDYGKHGLSDETIERLLDLIEGARWIPVSERLPTEKDANINGLVHVWLKDGNCDYEDWQDVTRYAERYQRVTHWMPLPKPPEVE